MGTSLFPVKFMERERMGDSRYQEARRWHIEKHSQGPLSGGRKRGNRKAGQKPLRAEGRQVGSEPGFHDIHTLRSAHLFVCMC